MSTISLQNNIIRSIEYSLALCGTKEVAKKLAVTKKEADFKLNRLLIQPASN
jgi:hypothetical protein